MSTRIGGISCITSADCRVFCMRTVRRPRWRRKTSGGVDNALELGFGNSTSKVDCNGTLVQSLDALRLTHMSSVALDTFGRLTMLGHMST